MTVLPASLILLLSAICIPPSSGTPTSTVPQQHLPPAGGIGIPLYQPKHLARRASPEALKGWLAREQNRLYGKYDVVATAPEELQRRALDERATTALSEAGYGPSTTTAAAVASGVANSTASANYTRPTAPVGMVKVLNQDHDTEYFASVGIGVPAQHMNVILDTGSADLWVASNNCSLFTGCNTTQTSVFNASAATTVKDMQTAFSVKYGSGSASGEIWQDYVSFGGYNVSGQGFALVDTLSQGLLSGNISGLFGLGFETLAASGITPFWQNLWQAGVLPFPGFAFTMSRFVNISSAREIEQGGLMTLGYLNESLFDPPINYIDIPSGLASYWVIPMDALSVNNTNVTGVANSMCAIDTGTTLIGGPSSVVQQVYASIPGALAATGVYTGYYSYPCTVRVNVSFTFGGNEYKIAPDDFNLGAFGTSNNVSTCLGAFFDLSLSSSSKISWVIGATFLKNVYSVFRAEPAAVGFAHLADGSFRYNTTNSSMPGSIDGVPSGIFGPSGGGVAATAEPTIVPDSATTAIQAGQTTSRISGASSSSRSPSPIHLGVSAGASLALTLLGLSAV